MFAALRGIHPYLCTPVLPRGQEKSRRCLFGTFSRLFGASGPEVLGLRDFFFQTFLGFRARMAWETPLARGRVRKSGGIQSTRIPRCKGECHCLRKNCPINSSNLFCCNFPVQNYRISSHTNFCCSFVFLPCFIPNHPEENAAKKTPQCQNYRLIPARIFAVIFRWWNYRINSSNLFFLRPVFILVTIVAWTSPKVFPPQRTRNKHFKTRRLELPFSKVLAAHHGIQLGDWLFYHYWCWRTRGAAPVKTSTGNNFPRKYQRIPRNDYRTGAKFWLRFCLSVLVLVILKSPNNRTFLHQYLFVTNFRVVFALNIVPGFCEGLSCQEHR